MALDDAKRDRVTLGMEFDGKGWYGGRGAMLDSQPELVAVAAQIEIAVAPRVEFGGASQRLSSPSVAAFAGMVHEQHRGLEVALQPAQVGEQGCDIGSGILVDTMQAHEGVEYEQARAQRRDGVGESTPVVFEVDA